MASPRGGGLSSRLGRISSGPWSHSLLTPWVCCKRSTWTPVVLFAGAAAAVTEPTRQAVGGGGTQLSVLLMFCFLLALPPSWECFSFYYFFRVSFQGATGCRQFVLPCILNLVLTVRQQCYLEWGLDPGFQITLTWLVIVVTRESAVTSSQFSFHPAFHKRVNFRAYVAQCGSLQAHRLIGCRAYHIRSVWSRFSSRDTAGALSCQSEKQALYLVTGTWDSQASCGSGLLEYRCAVSLHASPHRL